jgi:peptide/nickel transport system substrate-binding protein
MKKYKVGLATSALVLVASTITVVGPSVVGLTVANAAPSQAPLNLANEQGALWSCAFNPFVPASLPYSFGLTYESLDFVNALQNGKVTPWLASAYAWSNSNKTLTFTIRSGVKWTDGVALSAADVVYTFDLLKKNPALDLNSVWSVLTSVTQSGSKVILNFKSAAVPYFFYVAGQVPIVPEHIWSKIANPVTSIISKPVGTGGYIMSSCSGENIQWKANPHYWQKADAQIKVVNMPAFLSNNTCNEYLAQGKSAWGSQFIPNIKSYYVAKKAGNTYWFPPVANVVLFPNLTVPGLNDAKVRQAISYAINRSTISKIGEYGYEPAGSQTGIVTPTFSSWVSSSATSAIGSSSGYDTTKAAAILTADGYKKGSDGIWAKGGKKLEFTLTTNGGYSDWIASMQVLSQQLTTFGIKITLQTPAANTFYANLYAGKYQLAYNAEAGGPTPFYEMRQWLFSKNSAPIGTAASSNWERYSNPTTDALLAQYGTTTSVATQKSIVAKLESVMVNQAPVIPVLEEVDWFQYNPTTINNFPTSTNPYAQPGLYNQPDWGYVLDKLAPKA